MLEIILAVLETIASVALIAIVLLQSGKEAGLSAAISGNNDSFMNKTNKSGKNLLAKSTKWVALVWLLLTLSLSLV